jgi:hypothetical protein
MYSPDERGVSEIVGSATTCDAGAYQVALPSLVSPASPASAEPGNSVTITGSNLFYGSVTFGTAHVPGTVTISSNGSLTVLVPNITQGSQPITVTTPDGSATVPFTVNGPTITTTSLPAAEVGHGYSTALTESGGVGTSTWSRLATTPLPAGLQLASNGTISGTPTVAADTSFTVTATDSDGESSTATLSINVLTPQIKVKSSSVKFKRSGGSVELACATAECSGEATLTKTIHRKVKHGHKTKTKTVTVVLASGSYSLAAGGSASVKIKLTHAGHSALAAAATAPVHLTLQATVTGGQTAKRTVKVS